jgi:uncharacterized protein (TIGR03066 family)
MYAFRLMLAGFVVGTLALAAHADDKKDNGKLLVGTWEATKVDDKAGLPQGAVVDFSKDGKFKVTFKKDDKDQSHEGTYTVDGDKFTLNMKDKDGKEMKKVITIKKISDTECTTADEDGKTIEWKRKKSS